MLPSENTDKELWRESNAEFPNRVFITADEQGLGISYGGRCVIKSLKEWMLVGWPAPAAAPSLEERVVRLEEAMRETNPGLAI